MELTPTELITLRVILEYIFRDHDNCRKFLELVGEERYDLTRELWYSTMRPRQA